MSGRGGRMRDSSYGNEWSFEERVAMKRMGGLIVVVSKSSRH